MSAEPQFCQLYLVRHGETVWNTQKIIQGWHDSPLTKKGLEQAKQTAQKLRKIKFDQVFSSDLLRAQRTAEIIAADHDLAVKTSKMLREVAMGPFEGKKADYFRQSLRKSLDYRASLSDEEQMNYQLDEAIESYGQTASRMLTFLRQTALAYLGKNILVVSHSAVIRATLVKLGFATNQELPHGSIKNGAYVRLDSDGVEFFVKEVAGVEKRLNKSD